MALTIQSRAKWGAKPPRKTPKRLRLPVSEVWIHHDAAWFDYEGARMKRSRRRKEAERMRVNQAFHQNKRNYNDIAYNFVIFPSGVVYEGRGWGVLGAHNDDDNVSHGICFAGNFNDHHPTAAALKACRQLLDLGVQKGYVVNGTSIQGHRDSDATACPGNLLYARLKHLTPNPWPRKR